VESRGYVMHIGFDIGSHAMAAQDSLSGITSCLDVSVTLHDLTRCFQRMPVIFTPHLERYARGVGCICVLAS
jgi:hypothetical protein